MFHKIRNTIHDNSPFLVAAVFAVALLILAVLIGLSAVAGE